MCKDREVHRMVREKAKNSPTKEVYAIWDSKRMNDLFAIAIVFPDNTATFYDVHERKGRKKEKKVVFNLIRKVDHWDPYDEWGKFIAYGLVKKHTKSPNGVYVSIEKGIWQ